MSEVKQEINSKQLFKNDLNDLSVCDEVNRIAVAGENTIRILDKNSFEEITQEKIDLPKNAGAISKISWSKNGQILLVSTFAGNFYAFNVVINEKLLENNSDDMSLYYDWAVNGQEWYR